MFPAESPNQEHHTPINSILKSRTQNAGSSQVMLRELECDAPYKVSVSRAVQMLVVAE